MTDYLPPCRLEMEQGVLGSMLIERAAIDAAVDILQPGDFYREDHRTVYEAILALDAAGKRADLLTLHDELLRREQLANCGGMPYLVQLTESTPTAANAGPYARVVHEMAFRRRLIDVGNRLRSLALDQELDEAVVADSAERAVAEVMDSRDSGSDSVTMPEALAELTNEILRRQDAGGGIPGVSTGFRDLDGMIGGLRPKNLYILAARPSMGKTSLALSITRHAATAGPVLFWSLEMGREQVTERLASAESGVDARKMGRGCMTADDWRLYNAAYYRLEKLPIFVRDAAGVTVAQIRSGARRLKAKAGLVLIVVDHLLLLNPGRKMDKLYQVVGDITKSLRELAKEMDCPVLALCQLNRATEARTERRPLLSDLRESGNIEEHADCVLMIYRKEYYEARTSDRAECTSEAELIVAKQRHGGPTGAVQLRFEPSLTKFTSIDYVHHEG